MAMAFDELNVEKTWLVTVKVPLDVHLFSVNATHLLPESLQIIQILFL